MTREQVLYPFAAFQAVKIAFLKSARRLMINSNLLAGISNEQHSDGFLWYRSIIN